MSCYSNCNGAIALGLFIGLIIFVMVQFFWKDLERWIVKVLRKIL